MKCIILLCFVALCYSYPYDSYGYWSGPGYRFGYGSGRNININLDGSISITTANGRRITVSRGAGYDIPVVVSEYGGCNGYSVYQQYNPLEQILCRYQGDINQQAYQQLLKDVLSAVQIGEIDDDVYQALQALDQAQKRGYYGSQGRQALRELEQIGELIQEEQQVQPFLQQGQQYRQIYPPGSRRYGGQYVWEFIGPVQDEIPVGRSYLRTAGGQGSLAQSYGNGAGSARAGFENLLYGQGNPDRYNPYNQYRKLNQVIQKEREILGQQDQIQRQQYQQQQQQRQLSEQQFVQQRQQQQQQREQQYTEQVQENVEQEQEQVLEQQQRLQQQQRYQQKQQQLEQRLQQQQEQQLQQRLQQQQQYNVYRNLLGIAGALGQSRGYDWQQQPGVYSLGGLYGGYGQGYQRRGIPLVY